MKKKSIVDIDREIQRLRIRADVDMEHRAELLAEAARLEKYKTAIQTRKFVVAKKDDEIIETAMLR